MPRPQCAEISETEEPGGVDVRICLCRDQQERPRLPVRQLTGVSKAYSGNRCHPVAVVEQPVELSKRVRSPFEPEAVQYPSQHGIAQIVVDNPGSRFWAVGARAHQLQDGSEVGVEVRRFAVGSRLVASSRPSDDDEIRQVAEHKVRHWTVGAISLLEEREQCDSSGRGRQHRPQDFAVARLHGRRLKVPVARTEQLSMVDFRRDFSL